jgi:RNA polymerase sigma-70 factor (ECF subfamily)
MEGDRAAVQALLVEILPQVRNLVRYLVRGDTDVDDIAQDALVAVFRGLPNYRGDGAFQSWVNRIVARTTFASLRKRQKNPATPRHNEVPELVAATPGNEDYMRRRQVARLLDTLPEAQRHVLVLHYVLGMTVPEVGAELDLPTETVRSRLRLGKARLREGRGSRTEGTHE